MGGIAQLGTSVAGPQRARPRPSSVRALTGLAVAAVIRLLREGLVVRALAWPGMLTALSMFISASFTIAWRNSPVIQVSESAFVAPLAAEGFQVTVDENASTAVAEGRSERAVWREGSKVVLGKTWGGQLTNKAESVLRDYTHERWRLVIPPPAKRTRGDAELKPVTRLLAAVVGLLFALYGVVIGSGLLYRDRSSGVLESDLALAVPRWVHAAARLLALAAVLGPALAVSLLIVDVLLPIDDVGQWMFVGYIAAISGGALGFGLMARANAAKGFSGPLSQGLMIAVVAISAGYAAPAIGRHIPLVSLGSSLLGVQASLLIIPMTLLLGAAVAVHFHRRECL